MSLSLYKELRPAYGFDEVAIVPGDVTVNPELTGVHFSIGQFTFDFPIIAAALDAVVTPRFAVEVGRLGGLAVMNLEGLQCRHDDADAAIAEVVGSSQAESTAVIQRLTEAPIKEELIGRRVRAIKEGGAVCAVSCTPANTKKLAPIAVDAGADIFVVQSTVTTARHISRSMRGLIFEELCENLRAPVVVGNTVGFAATKELMETGIADRFVRGPNPSCADVRCERAFGPIENAKGGTTRKRQRRDTEGTECLGGTDGRTFERNLPVHSIDPFSPVRNPRVSVSRLCRNSRSFAFSRSLRTPRNAAAPMAEREIGDALRNWWGRSCAGCRERHGHGAATGRKR